MGQIGESLWVYVVRRLLWTPVLLLVVSLITFVLTRVGPGDPVQVLLGQYNNPEAVERLRKQQGLDRPILVQYRIYVQDLFHGDLGKASATGAEPWTSCCPNGCGRRLSWPSRR